MDLTFDLIRTLARKSAMATERQLLERELERHGYRITATAEALGCAPTTLSRAVQRHPTLAKRVAPRGRPRLGDTP